MGGITRSPGYPTGYPGYIAGGGYRGSTEELDATVVRAAELLTAAYDRDVEIRFNSDRQSGGAWLKDGVAGFWANGTVGLTAGLGHQVPTGMTHEEYFERIFHAPDGRAWERTLPWTIRIATIVVQSALLDPTLITEPSPWENREPQLHLEHPSLEAAMDWLRERVRPDLGLPR